MPVDHLTRSKRTVVAHGDVKKPTDHHPLVSVLMPCYNVEGTIRRCLDSVVSQDYKPLEIVCVNDGSTDATIDIIREYERSYNAKSDPGIGRKMIVLDKENGGYGAAMNAALEASHGSYIALLETDDWLEPGFYSAAMDYRFRVGIDADMIKTPYNRMIRTSDGRLAPVNCSYKGLIPEGKSLLCSDTPQFLLHHPSIWSALYKRSFLERNGIRFREEPGASWTDNPFLYETLLYARSILYLDKPFYDYVEDTAKEERAFYRKNPEVPSKRFADNDEVMRRLAEAAGLGDDCWCAHAKRGFNYIDYIQKGSDGCAFEPDEAWRRIDEIVALIPPMLVLENEEISPYQRELYFDRRHRMLGGSDSAKARRQPVFARRGEKMRFKRYLLKQGVYRLLHTNPKFTLDSMIGFLKKAKPPSSDQ